MDFPEISGITQRAMAYLAILEADLKSMGRSWVVRIWVLLMAMFAFLTTASPLEGSAADALAGQLGTFPVIWSTFVIIISAGAISSEAGVVADSVLSKSVTRYGYILAKLSSRLITVIIPYLIFILLPAYIITRNSEHNLSNDGLAWAVLLIGIILVFLTILAVSFSTLFNRTLAAVVVVWLIWYGAGTLFTLLESDYLSPFIIIENLPTLLQGDYELSDQWRILAGYGIPSIVAALVAVVHFTRKDL